MKFLVHNENGDILRIGHTSIDMINQQKIYDKEQVIALINNVNMKEECVSKNIDYRIETDNIDDINYKIDLNTKAIKKRTKTDINSRKVKKIIEIDNPTPTPITFDDKEANITNKQLQNILDRIEALENLP